MSWVCSLAALATKPTRRTRAARLSAERVSRSAVSHAETRFGMCSASTRPASVRAMPARERVNKVTPSCASNCLICLVSAGWETNSRCAARVRLPSSATAAK